MQEDQQTGSVLSVHNKSQQSPLITFQQAHSFLPFSDQKTSSLYTNITQISEIDIKLDDQMIKQALSITHLNSHRDEFKQTQLKQLLNKCFIINGVKLTKIDDPVSTDIRKKSYSIIKYKKERKRTIKQQEFQQLTMNIDDKQIIYGYDFNQNQAIQKQSQKVYGSPNPNKHQQQVLTIATPSSKKNKRSNLIAFTAEKKMIYPKKEQHQLQKTSQYKFKKVVDDIDQKRNLQVSYNMFNFCDNICTQQSDNFQSDIKITKFSLITSKIRQKSWMQKPQKQKLI